MDIFLPSLSPSDRSLGQRERMAKRRNSGGSILTSLATSFQLTLTNPPLAPPTGEAAGKRSVIGASTEGTWTLLERFLA